MDEKEEPRQLIADADALRDVVEVRTFIEAGSAAYAAKRHAEADRQRLENILHEMEEAIDDERQSEQSDVAFHLAIAEASHNRLLEEMMQSLTRKLQGSMQESRQLWFFAERATARTLLEEHRGIFEAILRRDEALAAERMMAHIAKVDAVLQQYFSK